MGCGDLGSGVMSEDEAGRACGALDDIGRVVQFEHRARGEILNFEDMNLAAFQNVDERLDRVSHNVALTQRELSYGRGWSRESSSSRVDDIHDGLASLLYVEELARAVDQHRGRRATRSAHRNGRERWCWKRGTIRQDRRGFQIADS